MKTTMKTSTHKLLADVCILQTKDHLKFNFNTDNPEPALISLYNKIARKQRISVRKNLIKVFKAVDPNFPYNRRTDDLKTFTCVYNNSENRMYIAYGKFDKQYIAIANRCNSVLLDPTSIWEYSFPDEETIRRCINEFSVYELYMKLGGAIDALKLGRKLK